MKRTIIIAMLLAIATAAPDSGWSWGSEEESKVEKVPVVASEEARSSGVHYTQEDPIEAVTNFHNPLPLEPHNNIGSESSAVVAEDSNREARFLGLSDTLCDWGVGISCKDKIKKKKGHGYRPSINSHYGAPAQQNHYNTYETGYSSTFSNNYNDYQHKPKGIKHKKKDGSGVGSLITGFLNSYTKPKANKGYETVKLPTYLPASQPQDNYGAPPIYVPKPVKAYIAQPNPLYAAPKPTYNVPQHSYKAPQQPSYISSKGSYTAPNPSYSIPKPIHNKQTTYIESSYASPAASIQKPKYIHAPKVSTVYAHTSPIEATKVQHLHSHTHVYHGANIIKPAKSGYTGSSNGYLQKKSDNSVQENLSSGSSFVSHGSSFGDKSVSGNGFVRQPSNSDPSTNNPFDLQSNGGFSSHTKFISTSNSHINGFTADGFQAPSNTEFGFAPSLTIEDMINNNQFQEYSRTIYKDDCQCVSEQFCLAVNVIPGIRDVSNLIDARNHDTDILSNRTTEQVKSSELTTTVENNRSGRSFNLGGDIEVNVTTEKTVQEYIDNGTEPTSVEEITTTIPELRRKRDTVQSSENFSDVQGRQLTGYTPGPQGCRAGTVCCRRPVYSPARALPVCGISNDETILGRIKTKSNSNGRAGFGEYPWQAAILRKSGTEMVYVCGATLINDQYLITAAHCVDDIEPETLRIRLGEWDVSVKSEFYNHIDSHLAGIYIHPEFYEGNLENDIAVLRLNERIDYSESPHISPVCLPSPQSDFTGEVCTITGWGKDGWGSEGEFQAILKETKVPVVDTNVCQQILRNTKLGHNYNLHEGMMCAGGEENKDACKGDGGGPLVCRGSGREYFLAGVVSWGIGCGEKGIPGVYVDVSKYVDWINSIATV